jgi:hypothetical protein
MLGAAGERPFACGVGRHTAQPYNTEGNKILEGLLREPSELRLFDEK